MAETWRPAWPTEEDPNAGLRPAPIDRAVGLLSICLSLVRPVGMPSEDAEAWLTVAAEELRDVPADLLHDACKHVRRTATHHAQIVPGIIKYAEETWERRKRLRRTIEDRGNARLAPPRQRPDPITQAEVDEIVAERGRRLSVFQEAGMIVRRGGEFFPGTPR